MLRCPECESAELHKGFPTWFKSDFKRVMFPCHCSVCKSDFDVAVRLDYDKVILYSFSGFDDREE